MRKGKLSSLAILAVLLVAAFALTWDAWADICRLARKDEESSHILLVPIVAGWLFWVRRWRLRHCRREGMWVGPLIAAVGAALYVFGDAMLAESLWHAGAVLLVVGSFLAVAVITLLIGVIIALVVKDDDTPQPSRPETLRDSLAGILDVIRTPSVGPVFVMNLVVYSSFAMIAGLWGGPYLTHVYGYTLEERGALLLLPAITQIIGLVAWGPMDRLFGSYLPEPDGPHVYGVEEGPVGLNPFRIQLGPLRGLVRRA